jgi:hypothetical protein
MLGTEAYTDYADSVHTSITLTAAPIPRTMWKTNFQTGQV